MPTGTEGESPSPWRAPTEPPVTFLPADDPVWADALPDPSIDPEPTGQLPVVSPALPTPVRLRRGRQRVGVLVAIIVPSVLFFLGAVLVMTGFGLTGQDDDSRSSSGGFATPATGVATAEPDPPPLATAAVIVQGDPAVAATDLSGVFIAQLRVGQFDAAAALTDEVWNAAQLQAGYDLVADLQYTFARVTPIGPDTYAVRLVFVQEPPDMVGLAEGRCEQWEVRPSGPAVVPGDDTPAIDDPAIGLLRGQALLTEMAEACAAMSMSMP